MTESCGCGCLDSEEARATISAADQNDLPDSDFAYIESGGKKDSSGKTVPRALRHFCIVDAAHVRNALARASQSPFGAKAMPKILAAAKKFGVDAAESKALLEGDTEYRADHEPFTGTHTHAHPAMGSQGDDDSHEHEHSHDGDADHDHPHADRSKHFNVSVTPHPRSELGRGMYETRAMPIAASESGMEGYRYSGYASIYDAPYQIQDAYGEYEETVSRSAFKKSVDEGPDTVFLVNHRDAPLARTKSGTLELGYRGTGLATNANFDPNNPRAVEVKSMVDRGDMDEMSFTFRDLRPTWNSDYSKRTLTEVSVHHGDVSLVNFGANGATKGTVGMRSRAFGYLDFEPLAQALKELRAGSALSGASVATLRHVLSLVAAADTAVDQAQPLLADLLGVANPDVAQDAAMDRALSRLSPELAEQVKRAIGDACNCCSNHGASGAGQCDSTCDGTCCDICMVPTLANADTASDSTDDLQSSLAEAIDDYEMRVRIARLRGVVV
ncbi:MAG: HK97 family phage prohead protease [Acidimicrobiales bacterium]